LEGTISLGKVRTERVKKIARELISRFPDKFTIDFEQNKKLVDTFTESPSSRLRNRIAGYITRVITMTQANEIEETETP